MASSSGSSFLRLDSAIRILRQQLRDEERRSSSSSKFARGDHSGQCFVQVRQLFKPRESPDWCAERDGSLYYSSLSSHIAKLDTDARFLLTFVESTTRWSHAAKVVQDMQFLAGEAEATVGGIAEQLTNASKKKYISKRSSKMFDLVILYQEQIEKMKSELGESLEYLLENSQAFQLCSFRFNYHPWVRFVESTRKNLMDIKQKFLSDEVAGLSKNFDEFESYLMLLQKFLVCVHQYNGLSRSQVIDDFITHAASVVVRTANLSCYCWFKEMDLIRAKSKITEILDLQNEIDPTNSQFLEFILKFLEALNTPKPDPTRDQDDFVHWFLCYLVKMDTTSDLDKELTYPVYFAINEPEESREDVQNLITEIKAILLGVAFLYQPLSSGQKPDHHLCSELLIKICLLKVELFLKKQLDGRRLSMLSWKCLIENLNRVMDKSRRFCKNLSQEKIEMEKQTTLALIEEVAMEVSSLYRSFQVEEITNNRVRNFLLPLLMKIVLFRAKSCLMELMRSNATLTLGKDQIEILLEGVEHLMVVTNQQFEIIEDVEWIFNHVEAACRRITSLSYLFLANTITEEMIKKIILAFSDAQDTIKVIEAKVKGTCFKFPQDK